MKKTITEVLSFSCFDDDGCTYKQTIKYTYPVDKFVFITKMFIRKKKECLDKLYDLQTGEC